MSNQEQDLQVREIRSRKFGEVQTQTEPERLKLLIHKEQVEPVEQVLQTGMHWLHSPPER